MTKRWGTLILVFVACSVFFSGRAQAADEISSTQIDQETIVTTVISEEVGAFDGDTGVKRQDQQQAFDKADNLDQSWSDEAAKLKTPGSNLSLVISQVSPNDAQHFTFQNPEDAADIISVTAENVDMKDVANLNDLGVKSSEGYQYKPKLDLPGSGANTYNGDTMQDFAPVPRKYAGQYYANESQNGFGDQNSYRNGLKFSFSEPISNFGVWVGDVETRTDGQGTPALLRLYDQSLSLILEQVIKPNNIHTDGDRNQAICGTENTTTSLINTTGCGHNTTRYIGFTSNMPVVSYMLIIVGDDDAFLGVDENNGNTEHISFMAPSHAFFDLKSTPNFSSNLSLCDGQSSSSSSKNYCLSLSFGQAVEGDLDPGDFNLSLSSGSAAISSIVRTGASGFQLALSLDESVSADISEINLSLSADAISRLGNNLSTNLESNSLSLAYVQPVVIPVDPVDPVEPVDPVDPIDPAEGLNPDSGSNNTDIPASTQNTQNSSSSSQDNKVVAVAPASESNSNLSLAASVNYDSLAITGGNLQMLILLGLSFLSLGFIRFKFIRP